METTMLIHQLAGPVFLTIGLGLLFKRIEYKDLIKKIDQEPIMMVFASMLSLSIGILIVVHHNLWSTAPEIVATLIGWIAIIKGLSLTFMGKTTVKFAKLVGKPESISVVSLLAIFLGAYMTWVGFLA